MDAAIEGHLAAGRHARRQEDVRLGVGLLEQRAIVLGGGGARVCGVAVVGHGAHDLLDDGADQQDGQAALVLVLLFGGAGRGVPGGVSLSTQDRLWACVIPMGYLWAFIVR